MRRTLQRRTLSPRPLAWRRTRIREWREYAGLSQQDVADKLAELGVELSRESIQRIETGNQKPLITTIEALALMFGTDVSSLLNSSPGEARDIAIFAKLDPRTRRLLLRFAEDREPDE